MSKESVVIATSEGDGLNERQRKFALEFFSGENQGNATRAYMAAYPDVNYSSAGAVGHDLLKTNKVKVFLEKARAEAREGAINEIRPWIELAGEAQWVIWRTVVGEMRSRLALDAAAMILDRAFGKPTERIEHELRDESRITRALMALQVRLDTRTGR